uniref:Uncharacterized protein n=1 Tax=Anopheles atroparvus TaxID=41427 RepID=A0A182INT6_ANOAO
MTAGREAEEVHTQKAYKCANQATGVSRRHAIGSQTQSWTQGYHKNVSAAARQTLVQEISAKFSESNSGELKLSSSADCGLRRRQKFANRLRELKDDGLLDRHIGLSGFHRCGIVHSLNSTPFAFRIAVPRLVGLAMWRIWCVLSECSYRCSLQWFSALATVTSHSHSTSTVLQVSGDAMVWALLCWYTFRMLMLPRATSTTAPVRFPFRDALAVCVCLASSHQRRSDSFVQTRRITLSIPSAWALVESRSSEIISDTPPGGAPLPRLAKMACTAPAQAPRLPSQYSGLGSSFSSVSKAFAAIQNSPTR